ncbi:hypothetical protein TrST_g13443 [Triparma strigata]|uniref:Sugar phosphate transporter domain-containing protein n=1 Tax=Triparma strigata TaxID=1606541 RepID=A0A9W7BLR2_9STRA|nr:hypothetical protein TrST_g13443 [Triparma strigata]
MLTGSLPLSLLIFLWYALGTLTITTSKTLLSTSYPTLNDQDLHHPVSPVTLTIFQFLVSTITLNLLLLHHPFPSFLSLPPLPPSQKTLLLKTSFTYTLGFLLTSYSFSLSTASFTETIKSSEPITSTLVALYFSVSPVSSGEFLGILLIILGVLSTVHDASSSHTPSILTSTPNPTLSLMITLTSNLCFSLRNVYQTILKKEMRNFNTFRFFHGMCQLSLLLMLPIFLFHLPKSLCPISALPPLCLNGLSHCFYNLCSAMILSRVSMIDHSMFNCLRRLGAILVSNFWFGVGMGMWGGGGIVGTVGGVAVYERKKAERKRKESLPR